MNPGVIADSVIGYQQFSPAAATALTIPAGTQRVLIQCDTQACRWRADGTDPTAAIGMPLSVGQLLEMSIANLPRFKIIQQVATTVVNVTYLGQQST